MLRLGYEDCELILVNVYWPCEGDDDTLESSAELDLLLSKLALYYSEILILVCGDFNCHLGTDKVNADDGLTGQFVYHAETNENGTLLFNIMRQYQLAACTTMFDSSTLVTRHQGQYSSQLDHFLLSKEDLGSVTQLKGKWCGFSDHKLLTLRLRMTVSNGRQFSLKSVWI